MGRGNTGPAESVGDSDAAGFRRADLLAAHERAAEDEIVGTDDAMLVERLSISVKLVEGAYDNIKITTPEDLGYAEFIRGRGSSGA